MFVFQAENSSPFVVSRTSMHEKCLVTQISETVEPNDVILLHNLMSTIACLESICTSKLAAFMHLDINTALSLGADLCENNVLTSKNQAAKDHLFAIIKMFVDRCNCRLLCNYVVNWNKVKTIVFHFGSTKDYRFKSCGQIIKTQTTFHCETTSCTNGDTRDWETARKWGEIKERAIFRLNTSQRQYNVSL